jgi:hypothetical protein
MKKNHRSVLKDITTEFNVGNTEDRINRRTVKHALHKNQI